MNRCVFFDRDGVVNRSPGPGDYVRSWAEFHLLAGFVDALRVVRERGFVAVVVTNQRGVARGLMPMESVEDIHRRLRRTLRREYDLDLLDILVCPHEKGTCACRKPQPGMLLEAARRHAIDLSGSWMVGDSERDIEAGRRAGCHTIFVGDVEAASSAAADFRVQDVDALAGLLAARLPAG
ncbi:MAG: HAD family hydrolase [Kiritimatiellae bacterium]|nr:HAD family hydrolase [Kiritimatiellia bacterium]